MKDEHTVGEKMARDWKALKNVIVIYCESEYIVLQKKKSDLWSNEKKVMNEKVATKRIVTLRKTLAWPHFQSMLAQCWNANRLEIFAKIVYASVFYSRLGK